MNDLFKKAAGAALPVANRRNALSTLGGMGVVSLFGCGGGNDSASPTAASTTSTATASSTIDSATATALEVALSTAATCNIAAQEVEGPYPLSTILSNTAIVRSDITEGKTGVPLTIRLKLLDTNNNCAPLSNAAVYIWHCDKDGLYSGYDNTNNAGQAGLTYLRGIQVSDSTGRVTFKTIYPGWYVGRITHIHVQVFLNNNTGTTAMATTQMAFPLAITAAVYNSTLYPKGQNTSVTSFAADNIFSDGTSTEMLTLSGSVAKGYVGGLVIGVDTTGATAAAGSTVAGTPPADGASGPMDGVPSGPPPGASAPTSSGTTTTSSTVL